MRKGQTQSEESRAKISQAMKGKPKSLATREKMSFKRTIHWAKKRGVAKKEKEKEVALQELTQPLMVEHNTPKAISETFPSPVKKQEFR